MPFFVAGLQRRFCFACLASFVPLVVLVGKAKSSTPHSFAASMNVICRVGTQRANRIGQVTSLDDLVTLGPRLVAVDDWELKQFLKLGPPPRSIAKHVARFISAQRQLNNLGRKAITAAKNGDTSTAIRLSHQSAAVSQVQETEGRKIAARACLPSAGAR
jgi:hypothetical protein